MDEEPPVTTVNRQGLPQATDVEVITEKQGYLFRRYNKDKRWKLESLVIRDLHLCRMGDDGRIRGWHLDDASMGGWVDVSMRIVQPARCFGE